MTLQRVGWGQSGRQSLAEGVTSVTRSCSSCPVALGRLPTAPRAAGSVPGWPALCRELVQSTLGSRTPHSWAANVCYE